MERSAYRWSGQRSDWHRSAGGRTGPERKKIMNKIFKIIGAAAVAAAVGSAAATGAAEHVISEGERRRKSSERKSVVITETYKSRFGRTKFRHREATVNGFGEEVKS